MPFEKSAIRTQMREILHARLDECALRSKRVCEHLVLQSEWISARLGKPTASNAAEQKVSK
jgi:hypothetical protein